MEHQRGQKSSWGQKRLKGRLLQVEEGDVGVIEKVQGSRGKNQ